MLSPRLNNALKLQPKLMRKVPQVHKERHLVHARQDARSFIGVE